MKVNRNIMGLILLIMFFGGIGISKLTGTWSTESSKVPSVYKEGDFKGQYDPSDIRGSYSFSDVSKSFSIPLDVLANAFGVDEKESTTFKNKDLEAKYSGLEKEIGTSSVKLFVALYKGLPYDIEGEDTYLPQTAVKILKETNKLTNEQLEYISNHTVEISNNTTNTTTISHDESSPYFVNGNTTFKELLDWGLSKEDIEKIIGGEIPGTGMTTRDYCVDKGIQFSSIKTALQEKLDSIKK